MFKLNKEQQSLLKAFACGAALALLLCSYGFFSQQARLRKVETELATVLAETEDLTGNVPWKVALYFIREEAGVSLLVPEVRMITPTSEPEKAALRALIDGPVTEGLQPVLPRKTVLRSLEITGGLAVVDFSRDVVAIDRGSWGEALVVWSVVNTLTKFPEIEAVRILIEGEPVETLAGHFDLTRPLRRNEQVIKDEWTR
ncbi:MAG: GerMN domain-containing protein [Firmicutes bacterium]|nr:GerMN domain-containing protein [Bacillota bacterium]